MPGNSTDGTPAVTFAPVHTTFLVLSEEVARSPSVIVGHSLFVVVSSVNCVKTLGWNGGPRFEPACVVNDWKPRPASIGA